MQFCCFLFSCVCGLFFVLFKVKYFHYLRLKIAFFFLDNYLIAIDDKGEYYSLKIKLNKKIAIYFVCVSFSGCCNNNKN